ncbi:G4 quadruplex nucleic acid binding protein [Vermiconidia calcicola]|uniref:G4 quadruplex nucleic acid binding protein n=1 Tax=Vermiconidia calcicola TaxID=1690605 RepID=A0ACC3MA52_9PEZI|nr:G4 quadruplex nucleic acid binding protein [Vermiconidia calcicola]
MATLDNSAKSLLEKSYPQVKDAENDPVKASSAMFENAEYTTAEKTEIEQWLITAHHIASSTEDSAKTAERLSTLNTHLSTRTTLLGHKPSIADVAMCARLAPVVKEWSDKQRTGDQGYHHIVRHLDFVQKADMFGPLKLDDSEKVDVNPDKVVSPIKPIDAKAEKERKKKEKVLAAAGAESAAAAAGGTVTSAASSDAQNAEKSKPKKEKTKDVGEKVANAVGAEVSGVSKKKEKAPKQQKNAPAPEKPLSPALIDLRVGHILKAENHPNADSLYVSTVACGDAPGTENTSEYEGKVVRTVCSGLNGLVPLEEMQGRKIVAVCNLKPVTMRGIKSAAMVLAASPRLAPGETDNHAGPVELVNPPAEAEAGERVYFEGWEGEPEPVLNPKKKVWDDCQVGFTTTGEKAVAFDPSAVEKLKDSGKGTAQLKTKQGLCTVKSLAGATVR